MNFIPIHRVFVSPFLPCIQTTSEVFVALSAVNLDLNATSSKDVSSIDKSKLKVAIEFGLCETLTPKAIKSEIAPKDGIFQFDVSDLESMFPQGMVDHSFDPVYKEMPKCGETLEGCRERYMKVVKALADKYPLENLLLVSHGEGVGTLIWTFYKDTKVHEVDYCAYIELRREISSKDGSVICGDYEVNLSHGQAGIKFSH